MNEIVFLPTSQLRALAARHAAAVASQDQEDADADHEVEGESDVLECSNGTRDRRDHHLTDVDDALRLENESLRDQLKFKDEYIKQLEARVFHLEIQQQKPHNNCLLSSNKKKSQ